MKNKILLILLIIYSNICIAQISQVKQIQLLINDSKNYFLESRDTIQQISGDDTTYSSKTSLDGNLNGTIRYRTGIWADYSIYLVDSASLRDVKSATLRWRNILRSAAIGYTEEISERESKNLWNNPRYVYSFWKEENGKKNWVTIYYAKDNISYYLKLSIGWQDLY